MIYPGTVPRELLKAPNGVYPLVQIEGDPLYISEVNHMLKQGECRLDAAFLMKAAEEEKIDIFLTLISEGFFAQAYEAIMVMRRRELKQFHTGDHLPPTTPSMLDEEDEEEE